MSEAPANPTRPVVWTILEVLRWTTGRFAERGLLNPRLEAELLAAHALGATRMQLYTEFDRPLGAGELAALRELVRRRQGGEPVAYLTGRREFWSLDLRVDGRVLIPRPDTETVVEVALELLPAEAAARVADVGTGSGAIALALKRERPRAEIVATDVSPDALAVARDNAARLGLEVAFLEGDLLDPLAGAGPFDLVTANLPYVKSGDIDALAPEVRSEPRRALDGGSDGLGLLRRLVDGVAARLGPAGAVVLEVGAGQAEAIAARLRDAGFAEPQTRRDLGGVDRVVWARRSGA